MERAEKMNMGEKLQTIAERRMRAMVAELRPVPDRDVRQHIFDSGKKLLQDISNLLRSYHNFLQAEGLLRMMPSMVDMVDRVFHQLLALEKLDTEGYIAKDLKLTVFEFVSHVNAYTHPSASAETKLTCLAAMQDLRRSLPYLEQTLFPRSLEAYPNEEVYRDCDEVDNVFQRMFEAKNLVVTGKLC